MFHSVDHEKLAHRVARQIEMEIVTSGAVAGDNLGTGRDIAARFNIGRNTLRQALTLVSRSGLARVRRGAEGGLIVTVPEEATVADTLFNFLDVAPIDLGSLIGACRQFQDLAIRIAIERYDVVDSSRLFGWRGQYRTEASNRIISEFALDLPQALSTAVCNPYLSLISRTLARLFWSRMRSPSTAHETDLCEKIKAAQSHFIDAILSVDLGRALALNSSIFDHLQAFAECPPGPTSETVDLIQSTAQGDVPVKRGEAIALELKRKIASGELKPGDRIGSENDLIEIYAASRGVIRDCARIMEQWSIATTVRGKGGGLYVTAPNADTVLRTAGLYLRSVGVRRRSLAEVGNTLDLFVAEQAARKAALRPPAELLRLLKPGVEGGPPLRERALYHYHILNELSDSRVVSLLVALHASLVEIAPVEPSRTTGTDDPARKDRERLFEAVAAGDPIAARCAMRSVRSHFTFSIPPASTFGSAAWQSLLDTPTLS